MQSALERGNTIITSATHKGYTSMPVEMPAEMPTIAGLFPLNGDPVKIRTDNIEYNWAYRLKIFFFLRNRVLKSLSGEVIGSKEVQFGEIEYQSPNLEFIEAEGAEKLVDVTSRLLDYLPSILLATTSIIITASIVIFENEKLA